MKKPNRIIYTPHPPFSGEVPSEPSTDNSSDEEWIKKKKLKKENDVEAAHRAKVKRKIPGSKMR